MKKRTPEQLAARRVWRAKRNETRLALGITWKQFRIDRRAARPAALVEQAPPPSPYAEGTPMAREIAAVAASKAAKAAASKPTKASPKVAKPPKVTKPADAAPESADR